MILQEQLRGAAAEGWTLSPRLLRELADHIDQLEADKAELVYGLIRLDGFVEILHPAEPGIRSQARALIAKHKRES